MVIPESDSTIKGLTSFTKVDKLVQLPRDPNSDVLAIERHDVHLAKKFLLSKLNDHQSTSALKGKTRELNSVQLSNFNLLMIDPAQMPPVYPKKEESYKDRVDLTNMSRFKLRFDKYSKSLNARNLAIDQKWALADTFLQKEELRRKAVQQDVDPKLIRNLGQEALESQDEEVPFEQLIKKAVLSPTLLNKSKVVVTKSRSTVRLKTTGTTRIADQSLSPLVSADRLTERISPQPFLKKAATLSELSEVKNFQNKVPRTETSETYFRVSSFQFKRSPPKKSQEQGTSLTELDASPPLVGLRETPASKLYKTGEEFQGKGAHLSDEMRNLVTPASPKSDMNRLQTTNATQLSRFAETQTSFGRDEYLNLPTEVKSPRNLSGVQDSSFKNYFQKTLTNWTNRPSASGIKQASSRLAQQDSKKSLPKPALPSSALRLKVSRGSWQAVQLGSPALEAFHRHKRQSPRLAVTGSKQTLANRTFASEDHDHQW